MKLLGIIIKTNTKQNPEDVSICLRYTVYIAYTLLPIIIDIQMK